MQRVPNFERDPPEAEIIQEDIEKFNKKERIELIFRDDRHGVQFEKEIRLHKGCGKKFTAALFLLTADHRLWVQVEPYVGTKHIDIESAKPQHLNGLTYVCFALAKDILTGSRTVVMSELADPDLLSPRNFMMVSLAMLIRGYGLGAANQIIMKPGRKEEEA